MLRSDVITSPRLAGQVRRYHTWPTLTEQTVADHSYHVLRIYIAIFGPPTSEVTVAIINHDAPELVTGDPPFPIKAQNPTLKSEFDKLEDEALVGLGMENPEIGPLARARIKICDLLEMHEFGQMELTMGNRFAIPVIQDTLQAASALAHKHGMDDMIESFLTRETETWRIR